jgi:folate-binding protein YgfZ
MADDDNEAMDDTLARTAAPEGALRLADWGLILARGADAGTFLHGQLTQDFLQLDATQARLAGYCSAKGRLQASFIAWRRDADEVLLACSADLLASTLKRLSMFVLRAKCKLSDVSDQVALYGLAGDAALRWLGDTAPAQAWAKADRGDAQVVQLPDGAGSARFLLAQPADAPAPALPPMSADHWRWLEVQSGVARIVAATAEQFVPQMVNLELVGGVNFQKGCYPGQEIVARSQYRGTLKRRAFLVHSSGPLVPGAEVFHSADPDQPAGMVALAAPAPQGGHAALVELKIAATQAPGELRAGDALLSIAPLPYAFPAEAV